MLWYTLFFIAYWYIASRVEILFLHRIAHLKVVCLQHHVFSYFIII